MKIKMPSGVILETPNEEIATSYLNNGGVEYTVPEKKTTAKKSESKKETKEIKEEV